MKHKCQTQEKKLLVTTDRRVCRYMYFFRKVSSGMYKKSDVTTWRQLFLCAKFFDFKLSIIKKQPFLLKNHLHYSAIWDSKILFNWFAQVEETDPCPHCSEDILCDNGNSADNEHQAREIYAELSPFLQKKWKKPIVLKVLQAAVKIGSQYDNEIRQHQNEATEQAPGMKIVNLQP